MNKLFRMILISLSSLFFGYGAQAAQYLPPQAIKAFNFNTDTYVEFALPIGYPDCPLARYVRLNRFNRDIYLKIKENNWTVSVWDERATCINDDIIDAPFITVE